MEPGDGGADLRPQDAGQRRRSRIDRHDLEAEHSERRGHLAADEPEADDRRAPAGPGRLPYPVRVLDGPEVEDARQAGAREGQPPLAATGGDDQPVVGQLLAAFQADSPALGVEGGGPPAEQELDPGAVVVLLGRHEELLEPGGPAQEGLGQRRALIGQVGLGADHRDAAVEAQPAQLQGGVGAGQPTAQDEDLFQVVPGSTVHIARIAPSPSPAAVIVSLGPSSSKVIHRQQSRSMSTSCRKACALPGWTRRRSPPGTFSRETSELRNSFRQASATSSRSARVSVQAIVLEGASNVSTLQASVTPDHSRGRDIPPPTPLSRTRRTASGRW